MVTQSFVSAVCLAGVLFAGQAWAKRECPAPVSSAIEKAYPHTGISSCKKETEDGKIQYEVKLDKKSAKRLEIDVSPEGTILQTEEAVKVKSVPSSVLSGFQAKYPTMKVYRALKQTKPDGSISYELAFRDKMRKHEATFSNEGRFVEEE